MGRVGKGKSRGGKNGEGLYCSKIPLKSAGRGLSLTLIEIDAPVFDLDMTARCGTS